MFNAKAKYVFRFSFSVYRMQGKEIEKRVERRQPNYHVQYIVLKNTDNHSGLARSTAGTTGRPHLKVAHLYLSPANFTRSRPESSLSNTEITHDAK